VARIHGYDRIPQLAPSGRLVLVPETESRVSDKALREQLAARGYCEAINFAFIDAGLLETWGLQGDAIALSNPLSAELGVMRTGLLPGLAATLKRNLARQEGRPRLFELGRVFSPWVLMRRSKHCAWLPSQLAMPRQSNGAKASVRLIFMTSRAMSNHCWR
jgi:phenylalanyl-tRNA synthetase beta chain